MKNAFKNNALAILINSISGGLIAYLFGCNPLTGAVVANLLMLAFALVKFFYTGKPLMGMNAAYAGLFKEIWIGKLMENFYPDSSWLLRSVDMTEFVENNTINLADCGVDPDVLVNNTTYPVPISERTDNPLELPLEYFDTKNTVVRKATAIQLAYNKLESVIRQHRQALMKKNLEKAAHAWGPASNSALTPVLQVGSGSIIDAFIDAEAAFDTNLVPAEGRICLLHPSHKAKLKKENKELYNEVFGSKGSKELYGFEIYPCPLTPVYDGTTKAKKAFGAAPVAGDLKSSLFYLETEVMRADGEYDMFSRLKDPEARGDIIGFQKRFIGLPIRNKHIGAVID